MMAHTHKHPSLSVCCLFVKFLPRKKSQFVLVRASPSTHQCPVRKSNVPHCQTAERYAPPQVALQNLVSFCELKLLPSAHWLAVVVTRKIVAWKPLIVYSLRYIPLTIFWLYRLSLQAGKVIMDPRVVVVDDTDNNIKYNGQGWFQDHGSLDQIGNFGPTYLHTLHGTQSNTSLAFSFNGTNVHVYGTSVVRNVSGIVDPIWECLIDGISFSTSSTTSIPPDENNWLLCQPPNPFPDGEHELTINITSRGSRFWIDDIQYAPSPNASLDSASIMVENSDPAIIYSSGWQALGGSANMTLVNGATMQLSFIGKSLSWYAFIPTELPHAPASATYSIDGGPPVQFLLNGLPASAINTIYNQILFTASDLTPGLHTLLVTNQGNRSTTPLPLDYLMITNGSTPNSSSSSFSSSTSSSSTSISSSKTPSSTTHASGGSKSPVGEIVGGVIGGFIFFTALFAFLLFWRRRKKHLKKEAAYNAQQPHPFSLGRSPDPTLSGFSNITRTRPFNNLNPQYGQVRKQRVMGVGQLRAAPETSTTGTSATPSPLPTQNNRSNGNINDTAVSRIVVHADSGIRIPSRGADSVIDIPPHYTAS